MTTTQAIRERITHQPAGEAFTPALFAGLGSRASIDMALMRQLKAGVIERIGRGVYVVPKTNRFGMKSMPPAEQVAAVVAKSEGAIIGVHGAEAARRFGFTTQMPTQSVFYTTGSSRKIRYGKLMIRLQRVAPRKLLLADQPAGLALSALWYLGRHQVTAATFERISKRLSAAEFEALKGIKSSMPAWMAEALNQYEQGEVAWLTRRKATST
ncbi:DUF6088 family protein [Dyella flagellata]|uniref:Transcriptional regulator, AbiEi antitoxin, Type IV TA system n=1 Tax=Dyella flagellata TaxID=1867833 RepID=A0ABQ5X9C6_9GAMM|nr:DUF6088 family protein [Dyella flagellata]GLQ87276.1 hypothetical protein GCM10007898_08420 [Dyella flagellata]